MNFIQKIFYQSKLLQRLYHDSVLSSTMHGLKKWALFFKYKSKSLRQTLNCLPRQMGFNDKKFLSLKSYKNAFCGKRCFITCTGPSLTIKDLESLKNEYSFGMNSIALIHDQTDWKPDFFGVQDTHVFKKIRDYVERDDNGIVLIPYSMKKKYKLPDHWVAFPLCGAYHLFEMIYGPKYFAKYSEDCYAKVYDGYSITYSLIQIAIYMGFDEIYLIGCDCNYMGGKHHFIETGHYDPGAMYATERTTAAYKVAKEYAETHGVKIINVTRGGKLEIFPRKKLEDVLSVNEKNKVVV